LTDSHIIIQTLQMAHHRMPREIVRDLDGKEKKGKKGNTILQSQSELGRVMGLQ
jgi:hypothetical protein